MDKKDKLNWPRIMFGVIVYLSFFAMGIVFGMMLQQAIIKQSVIDILSYSDVEVNVNFNETKLVQELNNTFIPAWKQAFNQTVNEQLVPEG